MTPQQVILLIVTFAIYPFGFLWWASWHCNFCSTKTKTQKWGANGCDSCIKKFLAGKITPPMGPLFEMAGCKRRDPRKRQRK